MKVLALDIATVSGWAIGDGIAAPRSGVFGLPGTGDNIGRYLLHWAEWFEAKLEAEKPTEVVFEAPILPKMTNLATTRKLQGLAGVTEMICEAREIPVFEAMASNVRRLFLGRSWPKKGGRDGLKIAVMAGCRQRGWNPLDDNEADALAILDVTLSLRRQAYSAHSFIETMRAA